MFQLTEREWEAVKKQIAFIDSGNETSSMWSQFVTTSRRRKEHLPFVFTEQGVAMLSSILRSERAIDVNIAIMRAFVILRQNFTNYSELSEKIAALEKQMNRKFKDIYEALNYLMDREKPAEIGFKQSTKNA